MGREADLLFVEDHIPVTSGEGKEVLTEIEDLVTEIEIIVETGITMSIDEVCPIRLELD